MRLSIIAAMSQNRVIGRDTGLPWHLPADWAHFKKLTMGHCLLMGRKTLESIGRPLPGRTTVVVTRQRDYAPPGAPPGAPRRPARAPPGVPPSVRLAHSLEEALAMTTGDEVFIAGGAEIYRQTLPRVERLYLTLVQATLEGDTYFPEFDAADWQLASQEHYPADAKNPYPYSFLVYERKNWSEGGRLEETTLLA